MIAKHLVIVNPAAGKKDRTEIIRVSAEREIGAEVTEVAVTACPGDATEIVADRLAKLKEDEFLRIYACGGDGTLSEVVLGMYISQNKNCALGAIPIGSGNDFIKYFEDIPDSSFRSFEKMSKADFEEVDALIIQDSASGEIRASLNIVSCGFDAAVASGMGKYRRIPLLGGSIAYDLSIVESIFTNRKHDFKLIVDGEELEAPEEKYLFVIAGNGKYYGGGFKASPIGEIQDGKLDLVVIRSVELHKFPFLIGKFRAGRHLEEMQEYASHRKCTSVQIKQDSIIDTNIDGEIVPMRDPTVTVAKNAIKLIIPRSI